MFSITSLRENTRVQVPATILTLGLMWMLPALVHQIPFSQPTPLGAYLLPIFFVSLFAAWFFDPWVSVVASLLQPLLNHITIGMPTFNVAILLSLELVLFSLMVIKFREYKGLRSFVAPFAVVVAKLGSMILVAAVPSLAKTHFFVFFAHSVKVALPGIFLLWLFNLVLVRFIHE